MLSTGSTYAKIALDRHNNKKAKKRKEKVLFMRTTKNGFKCNIKIITHRINSKNHRHVKHQKAQKNKPSIKTRAI